MLFHCFSFLYWYSLGTFLYTLCSNILDLLWMVIDDGQKNSRILFLLVMRNEVIISKIYSHSVWIIIWNTWVCGHFPKKIFWSVLRWKLREYFNFFVKRFRNSLKNCWVILFVLMLLEIFGLFRLIYGHFFSKLSKRLKMEPRWLAYLPLLIVDKMRLCEESSELSQKELIQKPWMKKLLSPISILGDILLQIW